MVLQWDIGNVVHIELGYGINPEEAEGGFAIKLFFRKTKRGHYVAMGPTGDVRFFTIVFELKNSGIAKIITGWDMEQAEKKYWRSHKQ